jgi:hypothetical protein
MAHFAKIGLNKKVIEIVAIDDSVLLDANGVEQEVNGRDFLTKLTGYPIWVQTSYNKNIRGNFAGIGYIYDEEQDVFIPPQTYPSWILNETTWTWDAPVAYPDDGKIYEWDEPTTNWIEVTNGIN